MLNIFSYDEPWSADKRSPSWFKLGVGRGMVGLFIRKRVVCAIDWAQWAVKLFKVEIFKKSTLTNSKSDYIF